MEKVQQEIITIDGPAASGKSTTARKAAGRLGWLYLDTGAMYRAVTVKVLDQGVALTDADAIGELAQDTIIELVPSVEGTAVYVDGKDVTSRIRTPEIDGAVGPVCEVARVREKLVGLQRNIGGRGRVVAEGRDMGTVVFPGARYKFYMTASIQDRAERRQKDLEKQGIAVSLAELEQQIRQRDARDSSRENSPMVQAEDAVLIDTSDMSVDEQVDFIVCRVQTA